MKILAFQPLPYDGGDSYWKRDMGTLVRAWIALGHEASLILLRDNHGPPHDEPLLLVDLAEAQDPAWWKARQADAVVFNTWGAPRYGRCRAAAMTATRRVIDRLDTDGLRSPRVTFLGNAYREWSSMRDARKPWKRLLAPFIALGRSAAVLAIPSLLDRPMAAGLAAMPVVTAESPVATARIRSFLQTLGHSGDNVHHCPHPVAEDDLDLPVPESRAKTVISVGRWDAHQKNFPMLLSVLQRFLAARPGWNAKLIGKMPPDGARRLNGLQAGVRDRIQVLGAIDHASLMGQLATARIFLMTSRHESFNIAAAEALCCGCSVVGPPHIASVPWFCSTDSGSIATHYTRNALLDALITEANAWETRSRVASDISRTWIDRVGANAVAKELLGLLEGL